MMDVITYPRDNHNWNRGMILKKCHEKWHWSSLETLWSLEAKVVTLCTSDVFTEKMHTLRGVGAYGTGIPMGNQL